MRTTALFIAALTGFGCHRDAAVPDAPDPAAPPTTLLDCRTDVFGETRLRHSSPVLSVALSPDGKVLATTAVNDPVVRIWDVATAKLLGEITCDIPKTVDFRLIDFATADRLVVVRHERTNPPQPQDDHFEMATVHLKTTAVTRWGCRDRGEYTSPKFRLSPDGKHAVGINYSGRLVVWDIETGQQVREVAVTGDVPFAVSPDGRRVAVVEKHRAVRILAIDGPADPRTFPVADVPRGISTLVWTRPDAVCVGNYDVLLNLDPDTGEETARQPLAGYERPWPRQTAGTSLFATSTDRGPLKVLDPKTLAVGPVAFPVSEQQVPERIVHPIAVARNGAVVAAANGHAVRLFDATTGRSVHPDADAHPVAPITRVRFSTDGRRFLASAAAGNQTWDFTGRAVLSSSPPTAHVFDAYIPRTIPFSPSGRRLATFTSATSRVVILDADTRQELARQPDGGPHGYLKPLDFLDDDTLLAVFQGDRVGRLVAIRYRDWDVTELTDWVLPHGFRAADGGSKQLAMSGPKLVVWNGWDEAKAVEVDNHLPRLEPRCGSSPPPYAIPMRFGPGGRQLLTWDAGYVLWDLGPKPTKVATFPTGRGGEWYAQDAAFSPDGRRLVGVTHAAHGPSSVCAWDTRSGEVVFRFAPPGGAVSCEFTPDGSRLLVAQADTRFGVWDWAKLEAFLTKP
jgi:WD40 repeat protein